MNNNNKDMNKDKQIEQEIQQDADGSIAVEQEKPVVKNLPMIALRGMVMFPNTTATLELGRTKSLAALRTAQPDGIIFLAAQKDIAISSPAKKDIHKVGVVCRIIEVVQSEKNEASIIVDGLYAARIVDYISADNWFSVCVEPLEYTNKDTIESEALLRSSRELLAKLGMASEKLNKDFLVRVAGEYNQNAYVNMVVSEIAYKDDDKQAFLEQTDTVIRLKDLVAMLAKEVEIARLDKKIAYRVRRQIDKGQKEYYLKEQMRAISKELGEDEDEIDELEKNIKKAKMPKDIEVKALKEVKKMAKMSPSSPDAGVSRSYVEWLCDLPWGVYTDDNKDLQKAKVILDEDHFGMEKIKQRIVEYLAVMQLTGGLNGPILCFVGPPGVGKTSIVKSIARALDRKYVRMSLGGVRDEAEIRGHRRTYIGAIPGKIAYLIRQAKCANPVMLFDEIDKMSSDLRGDPASAMLEVLDPEQNCAFVDHYLEVPFDLSKVLFVCTANTTDSIPVALLDRMEIIELSGYSEEEKMEIATNFLIPKQVKLNGLQQQWLVIDKETIREIVKGYTRESGVRSLEREIATLCRKIALKKVNSQQTTFEIKKDDLQEYLGVAHFKDDFVNIEDEIGSATGLAWTSVGGTTLTIDVALFDGKGEIQLTGMLGDVMKESARTAISLVKSKAADYGIDPSVFSKTDIHIHIPEGAIPKDGPSAGITMATAIMSAFAKRPVVKKVAMTGETTLRGKVLPIGGLREKTLAAYRAGIRKIIIPSDNQSDLLEIPKEVLSNISVVFAKDISDVFNNVIV